MNACCWTGGTCRSSGPQRQIKTISSICQCSKVQTVKSVMNYCFPWLRVAAAQILEWDFELEGQDSNEIPSSVLDALTDTHGMDLTGLKWSATIRGTRFRTHRLMP